MYDRMFDLSKNQSSFIFGPRGTGKTSWLKIHFPDAPYFDLLDSEVFYDLSRNPKILSQRIPANYSGPVIIDEVQKIPSLLDEVHRLIESQKKLKFILTGSSARKLKAYGVNLLAGRAHVHHFYPLTASELGTDFNLRKALVEGMLPAVWAQKNSKGFLKSYVSTYIEQEVKLEGLTRDSIAFQKFLECASFSQGAPLNISAIGSESGIERRTVTNYFDILKDLLISYELPLFSKRAKRELIKHRKFYFFDTGIFQTLRPRGPLDSDQEVGGIALESLVLQELMALNDYLDWDFEISYWHTKKHEEVDFILYGKRGLHAIEVKSSSRLTDRDFHGLELFKEDYKMANLLMVYGGTKAYTHKNVTIIPAEQFFSKCQTYF